MRQGFKQGVDHGGELSRGGIAGDLSSALLVSLGCMLTFRNETWPLGNIHMYEYICIE